MMVRLQKLLLFCLSQQACAQCICRVSCAKLLLVFCSAILVKPVNSCLCLACWLHCSHRGGASWLSWLGGVPSGSCVPFESVTERGLDMGWCGCVCSRGPRCCWGRAAYMNTFVRDTVQCMVMLSICSQTFDVITVLQMQLPLTQMLT